MSQSMVIALLAAATGVASSSGIWAYFTQRTVKNTSYQNLLMGLGYDKVVTVGVAFIERGYISKDEYEEYLKYFVEPYIALGGNGVASRIADEVGKLPFRAIKFAEIVIKEKDNAAE